MIIPISFNKIIIFKDTAPNHKGGILFIYPTKKTQYSWNTPRLIHNSQIIIFIMETADGY